MKRDRNQGREIERNRGASLFDPFELMRNFMGLDPFEGFPTMRETERYLVPFDVKETKDAWLFKADVPGVNENDIDISLTGNTLTVAGKREYEDKQEGETWHSYERGYGSFSRSFTLPENADGEGVRAELKNGELLLSVPKRPEMQPKKIPLGGGEQKQIKDVNVKH